MRKNTRMVCTFKIKFKNNYTVEFKVVNVLVLVQINEELVERIFFLKFKVPFGNINVI